MEVCCAPGMKAHSNWYILHHTTKFKAMFLSEIWPKGYKTMIDGLLCMLSYDGWDQKWSS